MASDKLSHRYAFLVAGLFSLLILLVLILLCVSVYLRTAGLRDQLTDTFSSSHDNYVSAALLDNASYLSERLFDPLYRLDVTRINEEVQDIYNWLRPKRVLVLDVDGLILSDGTDANPHYAEQQPVPEQLRDQQPHLLEQNGQESLYFPVVHFGELAGFVRIDLNPAMAGGGMAELESRVEDYWEGFLVNLLVIAASGLALVVLMTAGLIRYLRESLSEPILHMIEAAEEFARGNLGFRLTDLAMGEGEVRRLGNALIQMAADLSHAERRIMRQANFDVLTGLPNRLFALQELERMMLLAGKHNTRVAAMFLDLDDFKKVNDTLGHEAGDQLLIEAAERIRACLRGYDVAGRLGGDEFLVLMGSMTELDDSRTLLERLMNRFRQPFHLPGGHELVITVSIGVAIYPDHASDVSTLLRHADVALYEAKGGGRNIGKFFEEGMNQGMKRRLLLEQKIRESLVKNRFYLSYQPEFDIATGQMVGVEALLRWRCEELGDVASDEFIPVAESTGLIIPLGEMVWRTAVQQLASWRRTRPDFQLAVNLSPRQFRDTGLISGIARELEHSGVCAEGITFEITEGVLLDDQLNSDRLLQRLRDMGFSVAMDDFGTGYSSLSYLRSHPFDVLKVDKTFIQELESHPRDRELLRAAVDMAHALNLKVVAEGIETSAQLHWLRDMGCDSGQGYLFCRPVSAADIDRLLVAFSGAGRLAEVKNLQAPDADRFGTAG